MPGMRSGKDQTPADPHDRSSQEGELREEGAFGERIPLVGIRQIVEQSILEHFHVDRFESFAQVVRHSRFPHRHDFYNVIVFTGGSGVHHIDFQDYAVRPGVVFFLTPGQVHSWELSEDIQGYNLLFSREFYELHRGCKSLKEFPFFHTITNPPLVSIAGSGKIVPDMERLLNEFQNHGESGSGHSSSLSDSSPSSPPSSSPAEGLDLEIMQSLVSMVLLEAARIYNRENLEEGSLPTKRNDLFHTFEHMVETDYRQYKAPRHFAIHLGITPNRLNIICKSSSGKTAGEYIRDRVLLEAKRLLVHTDSSITEMARDLGYEDVSYFSRFFKKSTGITPEEFREKNK